jgi:putative endonuclease
MDGPSEGQIDSRIDRRPGTGRAGEDAAARWYADAGYRLLARNWRCRLGELDLIVSRGGTLVVVEVKARRGPAFGGGYEAVDARKRRKVRALTEAFLVGSRFGPSAIRFDVASVGIGPNDSATVEVFEDAF